MMKTKLPDLRHLFTWLLLIAFGILVAACGPQIDNPQSSPPPAAEPVFLPTEMLQPTETPLPTSTPEPPLTPTPVPSSPITATVWDTDPYIVILTYHQFADNIAKQSTGLKVRFEDFEYQLNQIYDAGFSLVPLFTGKAKKHERKGFLYFTDDGDLACLRYDNWKVVFMEQRARGTLQIWAEPLVTLRVPKIFNLRTDPYERADVTSNTYYDWLLDHVFLLVPAQAGVAEFLQSFKEFPPRQKAASFGVDQVIEKMTEAAGGGHR
jgi:hypothetical protein